MDCLLLQGEEIQPVRMVRDSTEEKVVGGGKADK